MDYRDNPVLLFPEIKRTNQATREDIKAFSQELIRKYETEIKNSNLFVSSPTGIMTDNGVSGLQANIFVTPKYIRELDIDLNNSIVILLACESATHDKALMRAFKDKGAMVVTGYPTITYSDNVAVFLEALFDKFYYEPDLGVQEAFGGALIKSEYIHDGQTHRAVALFAEENAESPFESPYVEEEPETESPEEPKEESFLDKAARWIGEFFSGETSDEFKEDMNKRMEDKKKKTETAQNSAKKSKGEPLSFDINGYGDDADEQTSVTYKYYAGNRRPFVYVPEITKFTFMSGKRVSMTDVKGREITGTYEILDDVGQYGQEMIITFDDPTIPVRNPDNLFFILANDGKFFKTHDSQYYDESVFVRVDQ